MKMRAVTKLLFRAVLLALLAVFFAAAPGCADAGGELTMWGINTGKSDAMLFKTPDGSFVLIDTGTKDSFDTLSAALERADVSEISAVIITHGHKDHIGGLKKLLKSYEVGEIFTNALDKATYSDKERELLAGHPSWQTIKKGDTIRFSGASITVLAPSRAYSDEEDDNNNSLVLRVSFGKTAFLLMGDATVLIEDELVASGAELSADVLKPGRHGKDDASSETFLAAVSPRFAYITGNRTEDAFSPSETVLERLAALGAECFINEGEALAYSFTSDGETVTAQTVYWE